MKKRSLLIGLLLACTLAFSACGGNDAEQAGANNTQTSENSSQVENETQTPPTQGDLIAKDEIPEGMVVSDLTGEFIDASLENQRPIAVMVDNEKVALPHYGLTQADIVYEMVNSTANGYITRLMALVKDWESIEMFGNVRSARTTNCVLTMEWNAILCHDGGPYFIQRLYGPSLDHLNAGFGRVEQGKPDWYEEYILEGQVAKRIEKENIEKEYNNYYEGTHFLFASEVDLEEADAATHIALPFPHNDSELEYNAEEQLYYYSEYGKPHLDPQNGDAQLCFKNLIIQSAEMYEEIEDTGVVNDGGYMYYELENQAGKGYYIVNGEVVPISWKKGELTSPTQYFDANGNELVLNVGKTYIAIVPEEFWKDLVIE